MDSSSVQQDIHLENRSSNGAPSSSEELLDHKAKSDLPVTTDEVNSKLLDMHQIVSYSYPGFSTATYFVVQVMLKDFFP